MHPHAGRGGVEGRGYGRRVGRLLPLECDSPLQFLPVNKNPHKKGIRTGCPFLLVDGEGLPSRMSCISYLVSAELVRRVSLHDPAQIELGEPLVGLGAHRPQAGLVEGGVQARVLQKIGEGLTAAFLVAKIISSVKYKPWKSR